MSRRPVASRPVSDAVVRAAGVWSGPIPYVASAPPRVWLLGASGGAGVTTLERVLGFAADAGRRWPGADDTGQSTNVVIVARETAGGLHAAQRLLDQYAAGDTGAAVLIGLITVAHRPDPMPEGIAELRAEVVGAAPASWRIDWQGRWPQVDIVDLPVWEATGHEGAGTIGELPADVVAVAGELARLVGAGTSSGDTPEEDTAVEPTSDTPAAEEGASVVDVEDDVDDALEETTETAVPIYDPVEADGYPRGVSALDGRSAVPLASGDAATNQRAMPRVIDGSDRPAPQRPKRSGTIIAAIAAVLVGALLGAVIGMWAAGVFDRSSDGDSASASAVFRSSVFEPVVFEAPVYDAPVEPPAVFGGATSAL
ncbi:DUF6668 family protein [Millisia brevis]|uniref:DUF6668 family protein n=1 Tax=Millisia brevis TaxID=264148 RepID=UPI0012ED78CB|nr:DUF6668 family protein [Millisia brevis]